MTGRTSHVRRSATDETAAISLLWPAGSQRETSGGQALSADTIADLQVSEVVRVLAAGAARPARHTQRERLAQRMLTELCTDPAVIAYRQEAVEELLNEPALREQLTQVLPDLEAIAETAPSQRFQVADDGAVHRIARQLGDLELFVDVARKLERALAAVPLRGAALTALSTHVQEIAGTPAFRALETELPGLRATLAQARSVTIAINLTPDLVPESATILSLSEERVDGARTLLGRLLGGQEGGRGITPLQRAGTPGATGFAGQPNPLTRDLNRLLEDVAAPVGRALARYAELPVGALAAIGPELALLLNGASLVERMRRADLPMCRPEILPPEDRVTVLHDGYDISLALRLRQTDRAAAGGPASPSGATSPPGDGPGGGPTAGAADIVTNAVTLDDASARIWILTGPNRAGKTTYTRAVGLAQLLFQAGLYVPARAAKLSPVDAIFTHFPSLEQAQPGMGRLDEEAERLAAIFVRATPRSLVLLNETLAGTAASEAESIARDAVRGLRLLGARAVYVTHLHELALAVEEINATTPGASLVGSLVADVDEDEDESSTAGPEHRRTFRILPGLPRGRSFASDIARRYGISFPQLSVLLHERGIATGPEPAPPPAHVPDPQRD